MEFDELLTQAIALLQRQGRLSYGALKRRFKLDGEARQLLPKSCFAIEDRDGPRAGSRWGSA